MSFEERKGSSSFLYLVAIIAALLMMNYVVKKVRALTEPPVLDAPRAAERAKALAETRAADQAGLTTYGWIDKQKGIVRVPIERAAELTLSEWKDPAEGRKKLLANQAKKDFVPSFE
jgi:hypothetical protein